MTDPAPILLPGFAALAADYDVVLSDVWGVVHNGVVATPEACDALQRFRAGGGTVVLISNAPRPGDAVRAHLGQLKVPESAYDGIVTSGDVTRALVAGRPGQSLYHLGPQRDASLFAGLDVAFRAGRERRICGVLGPVRRRDRDARRLSRSAWPHDAKAPHDAVRQSRYRGGTRHKAAVYCAGALADLYADMGGEVIYTGKPHGPIYRQALAVAQTGRNNAPHANTKPQPRVIAVGDSIRTDVTGADANGLDCIFVTAGIHAEELGGHETPDMAKLGGLFAAAGVAPRAVMRRLRW